MGTLLVATFVILTAVTAVLAYASYRRHSAAARARSQAALNILLTEAYDLAEGKQEPTIETGSGDDSGPVAS